eukprot:gnl/TRDRNA2_/TRDRNA2_92343_c0_seq1.p1 gnl/TRDRNA2_/TRDRNA2_92343_c0~~gnl/TRDRNA2_/TRDRNA2_92343_c0_seq1.p1  ORF type:complete len:1120 (+),score=248.50 gnl/TRDRNA2_/TRDRNA2_92343_c0_seq1:393-3362(+)
MAVDLLCAAQYLDLGILSEAATVDFAVAIAISCASGDDAAALFGDSTEADLPAVDIWESGEAETLLREAAPLLGERGRRVLKAWTNPRCEFSRLPPDCIRDILVSADALVREDAGVSELLAVSSGCSDRRCEDQVFPDLCNEGSPDSSDMRSIGRRVEVDGIFLPVVWPPGGLEEDYTRQREVCHAMEVVHARCPRYRGSRRIVAALSSLAVPEHGTLSLRMQAIRTLRLIALPGDLIARRALLLVIASRCPDSLLLGLGGASYNVEQADASAPGCVESPTTAAARRMSVDGAWQLRAAACVALEALAAPEDEEVLEALAGLVQHSYFEVRRAAVQALRCLTRPANSGATTALAAALGDDDWRVRDEAGEALGCLAAAAGPDVGGPAGAAADLVCMVCGWLVNDNPDVRQSARSALRVLTQHCGAQATANALVRATSRPDECGISLLMHPTCELRAAVVQALGDALSTLAASVNKAGTQLSCSQATAGTVAESETGNAIDEVAEAETSNAIEEVLRAVSGALLDSSSLVRRFCAEALVTASAAGNSKAPTVDIRQRVAMLAMETAAAAAAHGPECSEAEETALEVLGATASRGDDAAVAVAVAALQRPSALPSARRAAAVALGTLTAPENDGTVAVALAEALRDTEVQREAAAALERLPVVPAMPMLEQPVLPDEEIELPGGADEVETLLSVASDSEAPTTGRRCALRCLRRVAQQGNSAVLAAMLILLESPDAGIRGDALCVVARVAEPGDERAKNPVIAALDDSEPEVRARAVAACEALAERGDLHMADAIAAHVVGVEHCQRQAALRTLQLISGDGHHPPAMVHAVIPWLTHGHWPRRQAALEALPVLARRGDPQVIEAVLRRLNDSDETCRYMACEVLGQIAVVGDAVAVEHLLGALVDDKSWLVRQAASEALGNVAATSQAALLEALVEHPDHEVSMAAEEALTAIQSRPEEPPSASEGEANVVQASETQTDMDIVAASEVCCS